ncbi:unnamed protein product [Gongylonema pulchrum]|uniref:FSH1 domain-containing protein n=1 Tax=Gongylonema pulchrum TaxID=637853 RepID=A0A183DV99_9BILA|nr:unnamed protein product [Gongylonema pulchrum]
MMQQEQQRQEQQEQWPSVKLKVLCLHGYQQNAEIFREKSGSFRSSLKKYFDFGKRLHVVTFFLALHFYSTLCLP